MGGQRQGEDAFSGSRMFVKRQTQCFKTLIVKGNQTSVLDNSMGGDIVWRKHLVEQVGRRTFQRSILAGKEFFLAIKKFSGKK